MKRSFTSKIIVTVVALSVCLSCVQIQAFAQVNQPEQKLLGASSNGSDAKATSDSTASTAANNTNAEVLKELQEMRARIAELEAQLKAQQGQSATVAVDGESSSRATATVATVANPSPSAASKEQTQSAPTKPEPSAPFAFADWTWLNGTPRNKDVVWDSKFFTPEIRMDAHYIADFNHPKDDSMGGSTEIFR